MEIRVLRLGIPFGIVDEGLFASVLLSFAQATGGSAGGGSNCLTMEGGAGGSFGGSGGLWGGSAIGGGSSWSAGPSSSNTFGASSAAEGWNSKDNRATLSDGGILSVDVSLSESPMMAVPSS